MIPELIQGAKDVLSGLISGTLRQVHGKQVISFDIEIDRFLCDLRPQDNDDMEGDEYD